MLAMLLGLFCVVCGVATMSFRYDSEAFLWSIFWGLSWIALGVFLIGMGLYDTWIV